MSVAADILTRASEAGLTLRPLHDGRIFAGPRDRLTPDLVEAIREHRAALLAALRPRLSAGQEQQVRRWLASIGETDRHTVEDTLTECRRSIECRDYFLRRARHAETIGLLADRDRAFVVDADLDPVMITVGVAGVGLVDLEVPRDRWDPLLFAQYLDRVDAQ